MNPLIALAEAVNANGGNGMEIVGRPPDIGGGAWVRVWLPTITTARSIALAAALEGLLPGTPMGHLRDLSSTTYDGYQLVVGIPEPIVTDAMGDLSEAQRIAAGASALPPATPQLPRAHD